MTTRRFRVGVDVGGTFTDVAILDTTSGSLRILKVPTTPEDPSRGVLLGLGAAHDHGTDGFAIGEIEQFLHGTTITTNALIERRYVRCALVLSEGLRGCVQVQNQERQGNLYDLTLGHPDPLVAERDVFEVPERIDYAGRVVRPLDTDRVRAVAQRVRDAGIRSVAVCLLFSFANPLHERQLRDIFLEVAPDFRLSLSSDLLPRIREWPRISTMLANASLEPLLVDYVTTLGASLDQRDVAFDRLFLMESNGGLMPFSAVINGGRAVHTLLSGPAAAVKGALAMVRTVEQESLITLDIGGTSADIAFVDRDGALEVTEGRLVGHDVYVPMLDVTTIGAGGGTISQVNADGRLLVGPMSAGAVPGPACYGKGGDLPTTTDADLVLGLLNPEYYLGGRMALDGDLAHAAVERHVAKPLGVTVLDAAAGMVQVNDVHMADAIRVFAAQKGIDLASSTLVPCGGAGPLHAAGVASEIGIRHIIVPPQPGGFSAVGLLCTDVVQDFVQTAITLLQDPSAATVSSGFQRLEERATSELIAQGFDRPRIELHREIDARYAGQGFELRLEVPDGASPSELAEAFHVLHRKTYGHDALSEAVEIVSYRIRAVVELVKYEPSPLARPKGPSEAPEAHVRAIYHDGEWIDASIVRRAVLVPGHELDGPAIIEQPDTTTFVPPHWTVRCDEFTNLHLHRRST